MTIVSHMDRTKNTPNNRYLLKQFKTKCYGGNFIIGEGETRGFFQFPIVTFVVNIPRKIEQ